MYARLINTLGKIAAVIGLICASSLHPMAKTSHESLLVLVVDSSPSVAPYWGEMRRAAQDLIRNAPAHAAIAVVGIDAEARKSDIFAPARRSEALDFIQSIRIGGRSTDLSRGTDAALALLQQADSARGMVVYLTDGKLVVPSTFRQRGSFFELLRHEFAPRANIEVRVINVQGEQAPAAEDLPANVRFISLTTARELPRAVAGYLTPQVENALGNAAAPSTSPPRSPVAAPVNRQRAWLSYLAPGAFLLLVGLAVFVSRRRRKARVVALSNLNATVDDAPPDALREQDLTPCEDQSPECEPPVILITACGEPRGQMMRRLVHPGEQVIVGNNRFADLRLPGMKQARALQLRYDGQTFKVFRLRPQMDEELDDVKLNGAKAPVEFNMGEKDALCVGDFRLKFLVTAANAAPESWLRSESPPPSPIETLPTATRRRAALRGLGDQRYVNWER